MTNTYKCSITFPKTEGSYSNTVNLLDFGSYNWSRSINKNAIYVQLPVEASDEGGYGYDLGFLQDDFTFNIITTNYSEYRRLMALIKCNTGEVTGYLTLGIPTMYDVYNILIRNVSVSGAEGGGNITIALTATVVSKTFNTGLDLDKITVTINGTKYYRTDTSGKCYQNLTYTDALNKVTSGSLKLYGAKCSIGDPICIAYGTQRIYAGFVTDVSTVNNWCYYSDGSETDVTSVSFSSGLYKLNTEVISDTNVQGSYTNTPGYIAKKILGSYAGTISADANQSITFAITGDSILSQLNKLRTQCGWRYKCTPTSDTTFAIDFAPSFYQTDSQAKFDINLTSRNTNEVDSVDSEYGVISATSSTPKGENFTCTLPLLTKHNKDYTIDNVTYVSSSFDGECVNWLYDSSTDNDYYTPSGEFVHNAGWDNVYCEIDCDGDPSTATGTSTLVYYYKGEVRAMLLENFAPLTAERVFDGDGITPLYWGLRITPNADMKDALKSGGGDLDIYGLISQTYGLEDYSVVKTSGMGYLGTEPVSYTYNGHNIKVSHTDNRHMHKRGVMFTPIGDTEAEEDSPYALYGDRTNVTYLQSGLGYAATDYLVCVMARYGSNFDAQGNCQVPLFSFKSTSGPFLTVGDHISIYNSKDDTTNDYEMLSYSLDMNNLTVSITFGTTVTGLTEYVNLIKQNMTTSVRQ